MASNTEVIAVLNTRMDGVCERLDRMNGTLAEHDRQIRTHGEAIAGLQVWRTIFASIGGSIGGAIVATAFALLAGCQVLPPDLTPGPTLPWPEVTGTAALTVLPPDTPTLTAAPPPTHTPTREPTTTLPPGDTATPTASPSPTATATPSPTAMPTATPTPEPSAAPNLLANPSFEGRFVDGVAEGWTGYACAPQFVGKECPAYFRPDRNPEDLVMVAPEWARAWVGGDPRRVSDGTFAQMWFKTYGVYQAGIYQRVTGIAAGSVCRFEGDLHMWMNDLKQPALDDLGYPLSQLITDDDKLSGLGWLKVDPRGGTDYFSMLIMRSPTIRYPDLFDAYHRYGMTFTALADAVTVYVEAQAIWPWGNTNAYADNLSLTCAPPGEPLPTPTPDPTPTPLAEPAEPIATPLGGERLVLYSSYNGQNIRYYPGLAGSIVGWLDAGQVRQVYDLVYLGADGWLCLSSDTPCHEWVAWYYGGQWLGRYTDSETE